MKKLFQKFLCVSVVAVSMLTCFCSCTQNSEKNNESIINDGTEKETIHAEHDFKTEISGFHFTDMVPTIVLKYTCTKCGYWFDTDGNSSDKSN